MKILVVTPLQRDPMGRVLLYGRALQSIYALRWSYQLDHFTSNGGDNPTTPNENVTRKYSEAQAVFLTGTWDAMLCAESDMILPAEALENLVELDTDIAYGLYMLRHGKPEWNAYLGLSLWEGTSISQSPHLAREKFGSVIEVAGIGQGCTLIKRQVLECLTLRGRRGVSSDWLLALDAKELGFRQLCDLRTVCGHMTLLPSPSVLWPDPNAQDLCRVEQLH